MKIIYKDKWGIFFFIRHSFYLEDTVGSITELPVSKKTWNKFKVGDFFNESDT